MKIVDSKEAIDRLIDENDMVLIYFGSDTCSVCVDMKPKVEKILERYPKIKAVEVEIDKSVKLSTNYNIFTIPAILLFIDGKESIREARHISMEDLGQKINRYYNLFFR